MLSQGGLTQKELEDLEKALNSETKIVNIRLREGEYQHSLAKAIGFFELELKFPNAKELVKKLFGEEKAEDAQFISKIQTILKKMEKSGIIKILPKEKPWELQRYALTAFKFQDVEKNQIIFATKTEIGKTRELTRDRQNLRVPMKQPKITTARVPLLIAIIAISLAATLWSLVQPRITLIIFVSAFSTAAVSSTLLGMVIAKRL